MGHGQDLPATCVSCLFDTNNCGDIDTVTTLEAAEEITAHTPDAMKQFEVLKNRGHNTHQDDSRVLEVMKNLLTK